MAEKKTLNQLLEEAKAMDNPLASMGHLSKGMQELSEDGLKLAREKAVKSAGRSALMGKIWNGLTFSGYETSPTFFGPTRVQYEIGPGTVSFVQMKAEGIKRPHAKNMLKRKEMQRLYHHESGVLGTLETYEDGVHTTVRVPFRIVQDIGLKNLVSDFPGIQKGLEYSPTFSVPGVRAYSEGDIVYLKNQDLQVPNKKIGEAEQRLLEVLPRDIAEHMATALIPGLRELDSLTREELYALRSTLDSIATQTNKTFPRGKKELRDYASAEDLKREYAELDGTPIGMISMNPEKFVLPQEPYVVDGLLGRVFATNRAELNTEMRLPVELIRDFKAGGKSTGIILVDQYMKPHVMTIEGLKTEEKDGKVRHSVRVAGDLVYDTVVPSKRDFDSTRRKVDDLGNKYLNGRMAYHAMI